MQKDRPGRRQPEEEIPPDHLGIVQDPLAAQEKGEL